MARLLSCRLAKEFGRLQLLCKSAGFLCGLPELLCCRLELLFCQAELL
ncbi:hypothetical protein [Candidatus Electronema sp. PJ]